MITVSRNGNPPGKESTMNLKRKIMAALVGATFLVPVTAQTSEAASVAGGHES